MSVLNRAVLVVIAGLAWLAFAWHLQINAVSEGGIVLGLWHQLDYFTETTNVLVALLFTGLALRASGAVTTKALAVATISVIIVVLVYWPVLYPKFPPKPGTEVVNVLIHAIVPGCVVAYYLLFARKHTTNHRDPANWMLYPIAYTTFIMIRGVMTHHYPYFFFDPAKVGVVRVVIDVIVIGLIYFGAAHLLVLTDRRPRR